MTTIGPDQDEWNLNDSQGASSPQKTEAPEPSPKALAAPKRRIAKPRRISREEFCKGLQNLRGPVPRASKGEAMLSEDKDLIADALRSGATYGHIAFFIRQNSRKKVTKSQIETFAKNHNLIRKGLRKTKKIGDQVAKPMEEAQ